MLQAAITKTLRTAARTSFILGVSFMAPSGVTVLYGPSSSGKTTTLRAIAGIIQPDKGRISHGEHICFDSNARINLSRQSRRVGYVFLSSHQKCLLMAVLADDHGY